MIKEIYFCDADGKQFNPQEGLSTFVSMLPRMNQKLEKQVLKFEGNFCGEHTELILSFIKTLKDELESRPTDTGTELADKGRDRKKQD